MPEEGGSSEAESDSFPDWEPSSPDMRTSLLQQHHSRHAQHKQRQQHSRLAGRQGQQSQQQSQQQQQESQQHGKGSSSNSSIFGGLLSGLFRGHRHSSNADQHDDPAAAAAATADLLESGGSLTFQAASLTRQQQQEVSSSKAAGDAEPAAAAASSSSSSRLRRPAPPAEAGEAAARCVSEPVLPASQTASARGRPGQLNEQVFDTNLGGVGPDRPHRGSHSISLGQLSKGKRRWQNAAQKVIGINHITSTYRPGALQGLDVKRHSYNSLFGGLHTDVDVTVVDYNKDQVEVATGITNSMLPEVLKVARPSWSKVRWINVQGLSWDVITTLAVAFDLHPLSVEDIVHIPQRIKADYYPEYLYVSVILLSVDHPSSLGRQDSAYAAAEAAASSGSGGVQQRRTSDRGGAVGSVGVGGGQPFGGDMSKALRTRLFGAAGAKKVQSDKHAAAAGSAAALLQMQPTVEQASMFLLRDGTLITMFQSVGNDKIARTLLNKLEGFRSLLTDSQDASYLFNAVLDAVVDHTLPLVQVYSSRIATLESRVLLDSRPQAGLTKELHLLSNDLKLLRRTLVPTQHLVHKLQNTHDKDNNQGFLSPLTVLYLSDVYDHISTVVEDMISLAEDAKDLIDLIFNTIAHNNNSSMQMLAVVSAIFLPITFLAGVYGTNFDQFFPEIHWQYGYVYFWVACVFITAGFSALLQRWGMFEYSGAAP